MNTAWQFNLAPWVVAVAAVFVGASVWFFFRSLKREGATRAHKFLHSIRLLAALMVAGTLLRPERVATIQNSEQPRVAVLWDASGSMQTQDVLVEENQTPVRRAEWLANQVAAEFWKPLQARYQVSALPFSPVPDPATGASVEDMAEAGTDLDQPLSALPKQYSDLRAVILLSDGDWNRGKSPVTAATLLAQRDIPVFTVAVGASRYLPDIELLSVVAPTYGLINERISVMVTLQNRLNREVRSTLSIASPTGAVVSTKPITLPPMGQTQEMVVLTPQEEGDGEFKVSLPVEAEETFKENNEKPFRLAVRKETLKVLVIDSQPRWEFRYLRNALMRDPGVAVNTILYHPQLGMGAGTGYLNEFPPNKEDLQGYDVIFIGDVGIDGQLTKENCTMIKGLVEQQASGLIFLPGPLGRQRTLADTDLKDLLPVETDFAKSIGMASSVEAHLDLTFRGRDHWLTMLATDPAANQVVWKGLPGFYWYAPVLKAKPGTEVLAVHQMARNDHGRIPLLVTKNQGNGKVLYMGTDSAWRWRKGVEDTYHYRFWGQVVRWMSHQRHLAQEEGMRFFYNPENPRRGEKIRLNTTVMDKLGVPLSTGQVTITLTAPSGTTETIDLTTENAEWGLRQGEFTPREGGTYQVAISCPSIERKLQTKLEVTIPSIEKIGLPAQPAILKEIAAITNGKSGTTNDLATLLSQINLLPEPKLQEQRTRLWCDPWWGGTLLALLVIYWVGRKVIGLA